jgi:hypothetical protein
MKIILNKKLLSLEMITIFLVSILLFCIFLVIFAVQKENASANPVMPESQSSSSSTAN